MYDAHLALDAQLLGFLDHDVVDVRAWIERVALLAVLVECIGRFAECLLCQHHVAHVESRHIAASRADADDVFHTIEFIELIRVDADAWHTHAARHDRYGHALVGAGVAIDVADRRHHFRVGEEGLGYVLGAERIARHQNGLCECTFRCCVVRCCHFRSYIFKY